MSNVNLVFSLLVAAGWKSIVVLTTAVIVTVLLKSRSAALRHFVWTLAFAALLVLPVLSFALPALYLPSALAPTAPSFHVSAVAPAATAQKAIGTAVVIASSAPAVQLQDARKLVISLWACGVLAILLRTALAWTRLSAVRRNAAPVAGSLATQLARSLGIQRTVEVRETHDRQMPFAFGLLKPAVLMPAATSGWDDDRRRVVLLHELAHVHRGDLETHLMARIAVAFYWWNPLVWFAWRQFLNERERAADDLVLASGALASGYAEHLVEIARSMHAAPAGAIAMARPSQLESRISAILNANLNRRTPGRLAALVAAITAVCLLAPLAALHAQSAPQPAVPIDVEATIRAAQAQKKPEMLDSAAKAATAQTKPELARKLLDASLGVRRDTFGERSPDYAIGLRNLADLARKTGNYNEAETLYSQAAGLLAGQPESASALTGLGICALASRTSEKAVSYFEQAQMADPEHAGLPLTWLASIRAQQPGAAEDAEKLYQQALALETLGSADYAGTSELYARLLNKQNRPDEAKALIDRARSARKALAPKPVTSSGMFRAGKDVTMPKLLSKVEPQYSDEARLAKYEGSAIVYAEIGTDGLPHNLQVVQGVGFGLDEQAIAAINQWRFTPGTKDGQPVPVIANIEVNWRLL